MRSWYPHLCVVTALTQAAFNAARMLVSYRALALGADGVELGVITAAFSLLPLVVAVQVGRAVDNGHPAGMLRAGFALTGGSLVVLALSDSLLVLGIGNALFGFGQILVVVASQGFVPLLSESDQLDRRFAGWTLSVSIGQTAGLPIAGLVSSASSAGGPVLTSGALFALAALVVLAAPSVLLMPVTRRDAADDQADGPSQSVLTMLGIPGMCPAVFSSLVVLTGIDVLSAFLPVLGQEYGLSVLLVTLLLTLRTASSVVSRAFLPMLLRAVPRRWLLLSATLCSALPTALVPITGSPIVMGLFLVIVGFFWGIGQPLTMTWVTSLVSRRSRASALSLRLTGNRIGQVLVPLGAGAIAGTTGVGSVFVVTGALLWTSSGFTWRAVRRADAGG